MQPGRVDDPGAEQAQGLRDRFPLLREEPVSHAAGEERHSETGGAVGHHGRPGVKYLASAHPVPERAAGEGGQAAPAGLAAKQRRAPGADEAAASGERHLRSAAHAGQEVEGARAGVGGEDDLLGDRQALGGHHHLADIQDLAREGDADRADGLAGVAGDAEALGAGGGVQPMEERSHHQPDRAGVDVTEDVAADLPVRRADVGAGGAADAVERLAELGPVGHRAAAVVDEDDVHLVARRGAGDEGGVGGEALGGGAAGEEADLGHRVVEGGYQLLDPGQHDVDGRQGGAEAAVALVGDHHHGAALSDEGVGAGDAHAGGEENLAQFVAGNADLLGDVLAGDVPLQRLGEDVAYLLAGKVDGWDDQVAGSLPLELENPLAEVGLDGLDAGGGQGVVKVDLLADHRLGFGDDRHAAGFGQLPHDPVRRLGVRRVVNGDAVPLGSGLEAGQLGVQVGDDAGLDRLHPIPEVGEIHLRDGRSPRLPPRLLEGRQVAGETGVGQGEVVPLLEGAGHLAVPGVGMLRQCLGGRFGGGNGSGHAERLLEA